MPEKNKRSCPRERHDSVLEAYDEQWKKIIWTAQLVDFGKGGACFHSTEHLSLGDIVRARIRILGKDVVEVSGQVVWSRVKGNTNLYGIRFDSKKNVYPTGEIKFPPEKN